MDTKKPVILSEKDDAAAAAAPRITTGQRGTG